MKIPLNFYDSVFEWNLLRWSFKAFKEHTRYHLSFQCQSLISLVLFLLLMILPSISFHLTNNYCSGNWATRRIRKRTFKLKGALEIIWFSSLVEKEARSRKKTRFTKGHLAVREAQWAEGTFVRGGGGAVNLNRLALKGLQRLQCGRDWTALLSCRAVWLTGTGFPPRLSHLILQQPCEVGRD